MNTDQVREQLEEAPQVEAPRQGQKQKKVRAQGHVTRLACRFPGASTNLGPQPDPRAVDNQDPEPRSLALDRLVPDSKPGALDDKDSVGATTYNV